MNTQEQLEELVTKLKALRLDNTIREIKALSYEDRVWIFQALVEDLGGSR